MSKKYMKQIISDFKNPGDTDLDAAYKVIANHARTIHKLKVENKAHIAKANGEYWSWQGDDEDHLESLTCPVLIWPGDLRDIIASAQQPPTPAS